MALLPSRQFCPSSFHGTRFNLFACDSSLPRKELSLYVMSFGIAASSSSGKCLGRKSSYSPVGTGKSISLLCCSVNFSTGNNWLDKWNEPKKQHKPKMPQAVMDYRNNGNAGTGGSTMQRIVEKLKKFGYMDDEDVGRRESSPERVIEKGSVEDIFYVEEGLLPNAHGGFAAESSFGEGNLFGDNGEVKFPWEKIEEKRDEQKWSARSKSKTSLAELTLPESELRRLRHLTFKTKSKMRIGGGGITQAVVDTIHERWKASEIVRLKIEGSNALNMKRTHEILERKTGGLVIWRSGTSVSLYRGVSYENPSVQLNKRMYRKDGSSVSSSTTLADSTVCSDLQYDVSEGKQASDIGLENNDAKSMHEIEYEDEMDKWLDSLGPRYEDWQGIDPLPVDADMLPGVVHNYRPPLRILPYGVRATLSQKEATALRRLARVLPPHFALGRSRQLQGLAVAMIKLWEKSSIAKIALKRGVQLTTSERMAEDIKKLTGGVLLSRNKDYLVFYRGKNFLSAEVTEALLERERLAKSLQDEEEQARLRASALVVPTDDLNEQPGDTGTLGETLDANTKWGKKLDQLHKEKVMMEAERTRHAVLVRKLEGKLAFAERKLMRAERALSKVEESLKPSERQADPESISDEERFMFRKLGLRMKAFLLLGRRGVFDGTVENMHLHWKYRELVKIIVKAKTFDHVRKIALALEAESGGVLVSVDKVSKGYAIVVFRGKDYKRPSNLRPKNLLTKRKALARSIELQRLEALEKHVTNMQTKVEKLRDELKHMDSIKDKGDEAFYYRMDSAYPTDEEESEDEGDGSYLETNDSGNNGAKNDSPSYELLSDEDFANDEDEQNESERGQEYPAGHEYAVPGAVCSIDQGEKIHS